MNVCPASSTSRAPSHLLIVRDLGQLPYGEVFDLQRLLQQEVIESRVDGAPAPRGYLLLVEHGPPVITISRRQSARQHLLASQAQLDAAGVQVCDTDRGGDITYHGPGQLVVYPILDLNAFGLRLHSYMRLLEQIVIDTLAHFNIVAHREPSATGVWVGHEETCAKICAMGVRISRWVSMHGLALNVTTTLDHFNLIVPCGLAGCSVTSIQRLLGHATPSMHEVKRAIRVQFLQKLDALQASPANHDAASFTRRES